jgi:hypothetical protein
MYSRQVTALLLACTVAGCASTSGIENGSGSGANPTGPTQVAPEGLSPVRLTRVRVFMKDGVPQAYVEGEIGDGCNTLDSITQARSATTVTITATLRRQGQQCTMIFQYLNRWVPLEGTFGPGEYTVRANDTAVTFRLVAGDGGTLRVEPDPGPLPQ